MNAEITLTHLRRFYLGFSAFIYAGSLVELIALNHTKETLQWTPFILSLLGIALIGWVFFRPDHKAITALRTGMIVIIIGSLIGVFVHIQGNLEFAMEINPNLTLIQMVGKALGGANPLMAPGVLAVAAIMAMTTTYQHPLLVTK